MNDQQFQRNLVSYEQEQGFLRHITTLSTGSVILITSFLEKLFQNPEWKILIGVSIISFLLSVIGCACAYLMSVLGVVGGPEKPVGVKYYFGWLIIYMGLGGFLIGLCSLAVFSIKNIY